MNLKIIVVKTIEDLEKIREVKSGKAVIILKNDLDLKEIENFTSINIPNASIIIYGRGHKIYNMNIDSCLDSVGMFSEVNNLYVRNILFDSANVKGNTEVGILAGHVNGKLDVKDSLFNGKIEGNAFVGGIAGLTEEAEFKSVDVFAEIKGEEFVGGLVGLTRHYIGNRIGNFEKIDTNGEFKNREYGLVTGKILKK